MNLTRAVLPGESSKMNIPDKLPDTLTLQTDDTKLVQAPPRAHLFVGTPVSHTYPNHVHSMEMLVDRAREVGLHVSIFRQMGDGLMRTRNRMVAEFLHRSNATHLAFIDDDIGFVADDVLAMVASGLDVVSAAYPKKTIDWESVEKAVKMGIPAAELPLYASPMCLNLTKDGAGTRGMRNDAMPEYTFLECYDAPTGLMVIKRAVIETMCKTYYDQLAYASDSDDSRGETHFTLFEMRRDPENDHPGGRWLSEDYLFCRRCQLMGIKTWVLAEAKLTHTGVYVFQGCLATRMKAAGATESNHQREDGTPITPPTTTEPAQTGSQDDTPAVQAEPAAAAAQP